MLVCLSFRDFDSVYCKRSSSLRYQFSLPSPDRYNTISHRFVFRTVKTLKSNDRITVRLFYSVFISVFFLYVFQMYCGRHDSI